MKIGRLREIISHWDDNEEIALRVLINNFQEIIEPDFDLDIPNEETLWLTARIVDASGEYEIDPALYLYENDDTDYSDDLDEVE